LADHTVHVQSRDNAIVNRLNKTKTENEVDHESERQERLRIEGRKKKLDAVERVRRLICPISSSLLSSSTDTSGQLTGAGLKLICRKRRKKSNARNGKRRRKQRRMKGCLGMTIIRKNRIGVMMISCEHRVPRGA
jgi:hypothetical protein